MDARYFVMRVFMALHAHTQQKMTAVVATPILTSSVQLKSQPWSTTRYKMPKPRN